MSEYIEGSRFIERDWGSIAIFDAAMGFVTVEHNGYPYQVPQDWAMTCTKLDYYQREREHVAKVDFAKEMERRRIDSLEGMA